MHQLIYAITMHCDFDGLDLITSVVKELRKIEKKGVDTSCSIVMSASYSLTQLSVFWCLQQNNQKEC